MNVEVLFPDLDWSDVKIHAAVKHPTSNPLDVFHYDRQHWIHGWNGAKHPNHCWSREYIWSMIELHESDRWLFAGVFRVISHRPAKRADGSPCVSYKVAETDIGQSLVGRLIVAWDKRGTRQARRKPESMLNDMSVASILEEASGGEPFPGLAHLNHDFSHLAAIWKRSPADWRSPLSEAHGIYMITDCSNGQRYVGSATGAGGIWSRWQDYLESAGVGGNPSLRKYLKGKPANHAQMYFRFSLLETAGSRDDDYDVRQRESYWKGVMLTTEFGINLN